MSQVLFLLPSHVITYSPFLSRPITEFTLTFSFLITMSIFKFFLHHYIFCISLFFFHDEVYIVILLAPSRNLHLVSPHTTQFTFNLVLHYQVWISFFLPSFPSPFFLSTKSHRLHFLLLAVKWEWLKETYYRNMDLNSRQLNFNFVLPCIIV